MFEPDITPLKCPARSGHISDFFIKNSLCTPLSAVGPSCAEAREQQNAMLDFEVQAAFFSNASFKNPFNIAAFRSPPFLPSLCITFVLCSASFEPGPPSITPARGIQSTKLFTSALLAFCLPPSIPPASSVMTSPPLLYSCSQTPLQHLKLQITPAPHKHKEFESVQHLNPRGWKVFCSGFQQKLGCGG